MNEVLAHWLEKTCDTIMDLRSYRKPKSALQKPRTVAHRGAWDVVVTENSQAAFEKAREFGAWAIEFDVHFTKDLEPVVHHDAHLSRLFGRPEFIAEVSWSELQALGVKLPRLREVLALKNLHFMIEIKVPMTEAQQRVLEDHLRNMAPQRDYHLLSLRPEYVRVSEKLPAKSWLLVGDMNVSDLAAHAEQQGLGGVAAHYLFITDHWVRWLHERGMSAGVGFIPSANLFNREWRRGIDFVFTNHMKFLSPVSK